MNISYGNCEEELPKKPVARLSVDCRPSVDRQVTDSLPTANQQVTDRLRKKKNCGEHEQLTWGVNKTWTGSDRIGLTKPGPDRTGLTKPGPDPKKIGSP